MNALVELDQPPTWERFADERRPGDYPREELPEPWANAKVTFTRSHGQVEKRFEIVNLSDHQRYPQEPMQMIALKCFFLFSLVLSAYMLIYTLVHIIRLPLVPLINLSPLAFVKQIWNIVRIPFYFLALESAALYGCFYPIEGRAYFAKYESALHDGKTRRESMQYLKRGVPIPYEDAFTAVDNKISFFVAFCLQPIGKTTDSHIISVEVLPRSPPVV